MNKITPVELQPDEAAIAQALRLMTKTWTLVNEPALIELRFLRDGMPAETQRFRIEEIGKAATYAADMNRSGWNAYFCPNPITAKAKGPAKDADVLAACHCFADADTPEASEALRGYRDPAPDFFVKTGSIPHLRLHAYWTLERPTADLKGWRLLQKAISQRLGTDPAVVNPSRIMRLPGTVSWPDPKKTAKGYVPELTTLLNRDHGALE